MSESNPSGLRPPSRIGRTCLSQYPKPAVPPTPSRSTSSESLTQSSRKHYLDELDSASVSSECRTSSISDRKSSIGSDSMWWNARRLSEAGVRRSSDSSMVLTEDTDSFIIGEKVWVSGTKPGTIAFIGETHFGPQDWAGVVLDQPIGKNDGSVGNIRYFQCDPKRGIFCRLTRLTRAPLPEAGNGSVFTTGAGARAVPEEAGVRTAVKDQTVGPPRHIKSPSPSALNCDLKVGDRVIVMSSTGSKAGMLRYIGTTQFAPGNWCGIECDDPVGKNDGSVQGVRYFTCQHQYGLFAPMAKVSLSPSPNRRPSCAIHPPGISRQGTKDSITSSASSRIISSVARKMSRSATPSKASPLTNSTEAALKEKEVYIEQLLKERDLERLAVTRAASQAEETERMLDVKKQELKQIQEVAESTQADLLHQIAELAQEKRDLSSQLEDVHTKLDDLNFRWEEESLAHTELEETCTVMRERITQLERSLSEETKRAEQLEQEANAQFEAQESLASIKGLLEERDAQLKLATDTSEAQVQQLSLQLEHRVRDYEDIKKQFVKEQERSKHLMDSVEETTNTIKDKECIVFNNDFIKKQLESDLSNLNIKLLEAESENKLSVEKCTKLTMEIGELKNEFDKDKKSMQQEIKLIEDKLKLIQDENNLKTADLSVLNLNLTQVQNNLKLKEDEIAKLKDSSDREMLSLKEEITDLKNKMSHDSADIESLETKYKSQISNLNQNILELTKVKEDLQGELQDTIVNNDKQLCLFQNSLKDKENNIINVKNEYEIKLKDLEAKLELDSQALGISECNKLQLESEMEILRKELESARYCFAESESKLSDLSAILDSQKKVTSARDEEIKSLTKTNNETTATLATLDLELENWKQKCLNMEDRINKITDEKSKLENDLSELVNSSSDSSCQLKKFNDALRLKEKECTSLQQAAEELQIQFNKDLQKMQQELHDSKVKHDSTIKNITECLELKDNENNELLKEVSRLKETLVQENHKIEQLIMKEKEATVKLKESEINKEVYQTKLDMESKKNYSLIEELEGSKKSSGEIEVDLRNRLEVADNAKSNLIVEISNLRNTVHKLEIELTDIHKTETQANEKIDILTNENIEKDNSVKKLKENITMLTKDLERIKKENEISDNYKSNKESEILHLQETIEKLRLDIQTQSMQHDEFDIANKKTTEDLKQMNDALSSAKYRLNELEETDRKNNALIQALRSELESSNCKITKSNQLVEEKSSILSSLKQSFDISDESCEKIAEEIKLRKDQLDKKIECLELGLASSVCEEDHNKLKLEYETLETKLKDTEKQKEQMLKAVASATILENQLEDKDKQNNSLKMCSLNQSEEIVTLREKINILKLKNQKLMDAHNEAENEVKSLSTRLFDMDTLQRETKQLNQYKDKCEVLEKNVKYDLGENDKIKIKSENYSDCQNDIPLEPSDSAEDLNLKMQVDFLNSIIGDLQMKLDQQNQQIEQLRSGGQPTTARVAHMITPRQYCDICEEFDLHETEDCPCQAEDPPLLHRSSKIQNKVERPYCDSCGVFGHSTIDCDETY